MFFTMSLGSAVQATRSSRPGGPGSGGQRRSWMTLKTTSKSMAIARARENVNTEYQFVKCKQQCDY
jgi:hypothetical protein